MWLYDTGHGKIETMGALTISSLLLVTGGGIAWHAAETLQAWRGCPLRLNCQDLSVKIYSAGYVVVELGTTMISTILWFVGLS
jgi:divalent metal cation (Fe/Co/Zn/Cd) transporter